MPYSTCKINNEQAKLTSVITKCIRALSYHGEISNRKRMRGTRFKAQHCGKCSSDYRDFSSRISNATQPRAKNSHSWSKKLRSGYFRMVFEIKRRKQVPSTDSAKINVIDVSPVSIYILVIFTQISCAFSTIKEPISNQRHWLWKYSNDFSRLWTIYPQSQGKFAVASHQ